jgi:hypothetical protein
MRDYKEEYINYRIEKSEQAFADAILLASQNSWNACVNRLYYACYYIVSALALQNNIQTQTHSGLKAQFNLHFIKTNKVPVEMGKLYADLIDSRQKGDYGDLYDFDKETVEDLIGPVAEFITTIKRLISQS